MRATVLKNRAVVIPIAVFFVVALFVWQTLFAAQLVHGLEGNLGLPHAVVGLICTSAEYVPPLGSYLAMVGAVLCGAVAAVLIWPFVPAPEDGY